MFHTTVIETFLTAVKSLAALDNQRAENMSKAGLGNGGRGVDHPPMIGCRAFVGMAGSGSAEARNGELCCSRKYAQRSIFMTVMVSKKGGPAER
jgi:hypothetical protein